MAKICNRKIVQAQKDRNYHTQARQRATDHSFM